MNNVVETKTRKPRKIEPKGVEPWAQEIIGLLDQAETKREEWIVIQLKIANILSTERKKYPSNIEFGLRCRANGLDENKLDKDTRAGYIAMGQYPEKMRKVLEITNRTSIRLIYNEHRSVFTALEAANNHVSRLSNVANTPSKSHNLPSEEISKETSEERRAAQYEATKQRNEQYFPSLEEIGEPEPPNGYTKEEWTREMQERGEAIERYDRTGKWEIDHTVIYLRQEVNKKDFIFVLSLLHPDKLPLNDPLRKDYEKACKILNGWRVGIN